MLPMAMAAGAAGRRGVHVKGQTRMAENAAAAGLSSWQGSQAGAMLQGSGPHARSGAPTGVQVAGRVGVGHLNDEREVDGVLRGM